MPRRLQNVIDWMKGAACIVLALICVVVASAAEVERDAKEEPLEDKPAAATDAEAPSDQKEIAPPMVNPVPLKPGNVTDASDLEAFFDGAIDSQLRAKNIAGGVVAVVANGKLVFAKGYGYADVEARKKVDPEKTLFRVASISKLFTWTAVMQQVEEGKLDLETDINTYMSNVKIASTYPEPVTLKSLLTHTPGFDDVVIGLFSHDSNLKPLDEVLRTQMPTRVRPPGVIPSYSNHGTALAGYVVACVSGMPWEEYIEQRILNPLGMEHTHVRQPTKDQLPADLSRGYKWSAGEFKPQEFEYIPAAPAGCISMTAADAAKFMIAHLNDGQLGDARILTPETARQMRQPLFRPDPNTDAVCYGFMESKLNEQTLVGHGGDTNLFHSLMELIPDRHVGIFTSFNTDTSASANSPILSAFLDRYYPVAVTPRPKAVAGFSERSKRLVGEYMQTRYSHTSEAKLGALMSVLKISANDDDTITIAVGDQARRFVEVEPLVFHERDGRGKFVFQEGKDGRITAVYAINSPIASAVRSEWYESTNLHWGLLLGCAAIFATAIAYWPVIALSVNSWRAFSVRQATFRDYLSLLAWLLSVVGVGFLISIVIVLSDPSEIVYGLPPNLKLLLLIPQVFVVLAALTSLGCLTAWYRGYWRLPARLHFTLVAIAGVAFIWFLQYWNLLKFGV